jgi:hypothetical protein
MDIVPAPADHVEPEVPVAGIDNNHGADIDVETVPKTSFSEIITRGGNNPDGKFD